jgi:hypothetical protein
MISSLPDIPSKIQISRFSINLIGFELKKIYHREIHGSIDPEHLGSFSNSPGLFTG